ncbi:hypothetical protein WJX77_000920 [Trebouxia sp. C0004]
MGSRTSSTTTIGNPHPTICTRTISSLPTPTTSNFTITNPTSTFPTSNIPSTTISTPIISLPTPPATAATNTASPVIACDHSSVGSQVYADGCFASRSVPGKSSPVTFTASVEGGLTIQTTAATITPYYMQYTATDALGNTATPVVRSVRCVYDQCPPERYCSATGQCSMYGICLGIVPTTGNTVPTMMLVATACTRDHLHQTGHHLQGLRIRAASHSRG